MNNIVALFLTLGIGLFMLLGSFIVFFTNNNNKFVSFSISMSLSILIFLLGLDLIPEAFEMVASKGNFLGIIILGFLILIGILLLKSLDSLIPHHHDDHCHDEHEIETHLYHVGLVSTIAIVLHNIIEGMAIYGTTISSLQSGLLMGMGISLHNIPLGIAVTAELYSANKSIKKTSTYIFAMAISTFIGGIIMVPISLTPFSDLLLSLLLGITIGMVLYIIFSELIPNIARIRNIKYTILGFATGFLIMMLTLLI